MSATRWWLVPRFLVCSLVLWGCSSQEPTRFYQLTPERLAADQESGSGGLRLELGPVLIPDYLDRPQLLTRVSPNELQLAEFAHWAEPLARNLEEVLAENLLGATGASVVYLFRRPRAEDVDCRVDVRFLRFDGERSGTCRLVAEWRLSGEVVGPEGRLRRSAYEGRTQGVGLAGVVGGLNRLLHKLSEEIAAEIRQLRTP